MATSFNDLFYHAKRSVRIVAQVRRWPDISVKDSEVAGHLLTCPGSISHSGQPYTMWRPDLFSNRPQRLLLVLRRRIAGDYARRHLASALDARRRMAPRLAPPDHNAPLTQPSNLIP